MRDNMTNRSDVFSPVQRLRLFRAMIHKKSSPSLTRGCLLIAVALTLAVPASAEWKEKVLYSFQGGANDGYVPAGGVVFDPQGNLYGATTDGGPQTCKPIGGACGTVFQLTPPAQKGGSWTETLIYQFQGKGSNDASVPNGGLIRDAAGNLYGVTAYGGTGNCLLLGVQAGCGTVYELSPPKQKGGAWTETILYSFPTAKQGYFPNGDLVFDSARNLYGATAFGGGKGTTCDMFYGGQCGVVFKLSPPKTKGGQWTEKVLHSFASGNDGANPNGGLVLNNSGVVYGTTYAGGNEGGECGSGGCGTVFKLSPPSMKGRSWTEEVLDRFNPVNSGAAQPAAGVTVRSGILYGTTVGGGNSGSGTIFQLAQRSNGKWIESVLYRFQDRADGSEPRGGVVFDSKGNLYGTATGGGTVGGGTIFRLQPSGRSWSFTSLYDFTGAPDGSYPSGNLTFDKSGDLYGTTQQSGNVQACGNYGCGTVFEVWP
jgi:uncharacterized repeat protein (TIGR03803 family)